MTVDELIAELMNYPDDFKIKLQIDDSIEDITSIWVTNDTVLLSNE